MGSSLLTGVRLRTCKGKMMEQWALVWLVPRYIIPLARKNAWASFCEIGASTGDTADAILSIPEISYTVIDPCFDADLALKYANDTRVKVHKGNSLDVLPKLEGVYDCIFIDGDHNWYTVVNELRLIRQRGLLRRGGMIFVHDIGWPYARRDLYYQPETIPAEYQQEYERKGIVRGHSPLVESGGANKHLCNSVSEGGPRNGVLTAVEDFIAEHPFDYNFCRVRYGFELGVLQYRRHQPSEELSFKLLQMKGWLFTLRRLLPSEIVIVLKQTFWGHLLKQMVRQFSDPKKGNSPPATT